MTITTDRPPAGTVTEDPSRFDDAVAVLKLAKITRGLPFPSTSRDQAAFRFTDIVHAEDARKAVAWAETVLSGSFGVAFQPKDTPRIGSGGHYVLEAFLPSGLRLVIVAKAGIWGSPDAREDAPVLAEVAA